MLHQRITESGLIGTKALAVFLYYYFIILVVLVVVFVKTTSIVLEMQSCCIMIHGRLTDNRYIFP